MKEVIQTTKIIAWEQKKIRTSKRMWYVTKRRKKELHAVGDLSSTRGLYPNLGVLDLIF